MIEKLVQYKKNRYRGNLQKAFEALYRRSNYSYMINDVLKQQGVSKETEEYKYHYLIHKLTHIKEVDGNFSMKRIGSNYDGGYILAKDNDANSYSSSKIAYSLGISDDVSFDLDLAKEGYALYQYDHTIDSLPYENTNFHWDKIGITGGRETDQLKHLDTLLRINGHEDKEGMILKADIEGAEWAMIHNCSEKMLKKFDQIIIEFHSIFDFSKRKYMINTLKKISNTHQVIHVHANNNSFVYFADDLITPDVIEVTYLLKEKYKFNDVDRILPLSIDSPCRLEYGDIIPGRWNV